MDDFMREARDGNPTGTQSAINEIDSLIFNSCRVLAGLIEENKDVKLQAFLREELGVLFIARNALC